MEPKIAARERRKGSKAMLGVGIAVALVVCLLIAVLGGLLSRYQVLSSNTVIDISNVYMKEITEQLNSHFNTNLSSQFAQIDTIFNTMADEDLADEASVQAFLTRRQEENGFARLALVDDQGMVHSTQGVLPGISRISQLTQLLSGGAAMVSFNETIWDEDMLLLGKSIAPRSFEGGNFVAVIAGIDANSIVEKLALNKENSETHATIMDRQGAILIQRRSEGTWRAGYNFFSLLQSSGVFDEGYSLAAMQQDFEQGREGTQIASIGGEKVMLYYVPIPGTEWFMCTEIPYAVVEAPVSELSQLLIHIAVIFFALLFLLIMSVFAVYVRNMRINSRRLLEERDRAEAATLAKSQFLSQMSHEIRTPISGIIGLTSMSREAVDQPVKLMSYLDKAEVSAKHLLGIINDILDMSKIESGKIQLNVEPFVLSDILEAQVMMFSLQAKAKGIKYSVAMEGGFERYLMGDSLRVRQIITNLLSNAFKFTPKGGSVVLRFRQERQEQDRVWLRIQVQDTGCGIAPENQDRIFEAFEQERKDVSRVYGGTGLGLPITRRLVELMEGSIEVHSTPGKGSTFSVLIPFACQKERPRQAPEPVYFSLLVSTDDTNLTYFVQRMGEGGFHVDYAASPDEAARMAQAAAAGGKPYEVCFLSGLTLDDLAGTATAIERAAGAAPRFVVVGTDKADAEERADMVKDAPVLAFPETDSEVDDLRKALSGQVQSQAPKQLKYGGCLAGKNVLVAEDNDINMMIVISMLEETGAHMVEAKNGREALDAFQRSPEGFFDFVLMDMQMPMMSGCEATEQIRRLPRADAQTVRIFAMTANALKEDQQACLASGMNAHIVKPFDLAKIMDCCRVHGVLA